MRADFAGKRSAPVDWIRGGDGGKFMKNEQTGRGRGSGGGGGGGGGGAGAGAGEGVGAQKRGLGEEVSTVEHKRRMQREARWASQ